VQGAVTCFIALVAVLILPDYPATTKSLSMRQRALAVYRLEVDSGVKDGEATIGVLANLKSVVVDWRVRHSSRSRIFKD